VSSPSQLGRHRTLGTHNAHFGVDQKALLYNQNPTISTVVRSLTKLPGRDVSPETEGAVRNAQ
jgi:hypothetical protein